MQIFNVFKERRDIEKKYLPLIHAELQKLNDAKSQQAHETVAVFRDVVRELKALAMNESNFIEVIRHFFAIERGQRDKVEKERLEMLENVKAGKHDDLF
jgi:hypothetical protein